MQRPKSFKTIVHEASAVLSRHGFDIKKKLKSGYGVDVSIYSKKLTDGCVFSIHMGEPCSITIMFHEDFLQMLYSALFVLTFNNYTVDVISIDVTPNTKYSCILNDLKNKLKGE